MARCSVFDGAMGKILRLVGLLRILNTQVDLSRCACLDEVEMVWNEVASVLRI